MPSKLGELERAIEIARSQSAKPYELRAKTSLAQLLAKLELRTEARTLLADIYGWSPKASTPPI
jgi:hypothetical protein